MPLDYNGGVTRPGKRDTRRPRTARAKRTVGRTDPAVPQLTDAVARGLLDAAPDAIVVADADGRILLVNAQTEKLFGYPRAELLGQPVEMLLPERFRDAHRRHRALDAVEPRAGAVRASLELRARRKDGTELPVEVSSSSLQTPDGLLVTTAIRDITGRKGSETRFQALLEGAPDAMVIVDRAGRLVLVNAQAEVLFGYSRAELLGQAVELLLS
jgi:PAS domain S-box-containing protein